jgi:hypothetical protein
MTELEKIHETETQVLRAKLADLLAENAELKKLILKREKMKSQEKDLVWALRES